MGAMSSVLGHGLAGMTVWALARRTPALQSLDHKGWWVAAAAGGCLPDLDSLIGLAHRGPTHTLGFAIAVAALGAAGLAAAGKRREALAFLPAYALIVWLHPIMDLLNGGGPSVALFAPFWSRPLPPIAGGLPLHGYTHDWTDLGGLLLESRTMQGMLIEAAIFGPLFAATVVKRKPYNLALGAVGTVVWITFAVLH
jgi:hypothetical protein